MTRPKTARNDDVVYIAPGSFGRNAWSSLWSYRELLFAFVRRDISVRYRQAAFGVAWVLIRPLVTMVVFTVIFGRLANLPVENGVPYSLMVLAGLLPWNLFSTGLGEAANSLLGNAHLIAKVYFPRIIIPAAVIVTAMFDFLISLIILAGLMIWLSFLPSWQIILLPAFVIMAALAALGPGLYFAALSAKYRDFRVIVPFALQAGLYLSPVGYNAKVVPGAWHLFYDLNPLVGVINGVRWCIIGGDEQLDWPSVAISMAVIFVMLVIGIRKFSRSESTIMDVI